MKWSFRIATIAGTEVRIHVTFLLLLAFVMMQAMQGGGGVGAALETGAFILAIFTCVVLHEFGHAFAARGYGIRTPDITLLPIGGVARLERMPRKPVQELVVAICGPLVNVAIGAAIMLGLGLGMKSPDAFEFGARGHFWENLMIWNWMMVAFNLIPAFPMDGGRVLRAFLAMFLDYGRATRWAATLGQSIAMIAVIWMLLAGALNPMLLLIAFFIFIAAGHEAAAVTQQEATQNLRVRDAMLTDFRALPPDAPLRDGVEMLLAGSQQDFPVLDSSGRLLGMLSRNGLISALSKHGALLPVAEAMEECRDFVAPAEPLNGALERLNATSCPALPVQDSLTGRLIGLLTAENVGEVLMVRAALRGQRQAGG